MEQLHTNWRGTTQPWSWQSTTKPVEPRQPSDLWRQRYTLTTTTRAWQRLLTHLSQRAGLPEYTRFSRQFDRLGRADIHLYLWLATPPEPRRAQHRALDPYALAHSAQMIGPARTRRSSRHGRGSPRPGRRCRSPRVVMTTFWPVVLSLLGHGRSEGHRRICREQSLGRTSPLRIPNRHLFPVRPIGVHHDAAS